MTTTTEAFLTAAKFALLSKPIDSSRQELVKGNVFTKPPPGFQHGRVQKNVLVLFDSSLRDHPLGTVVGETRVRTEEDPDSVLGPDASYWSKEQIPLGEAPIGYANTPADLVVEIISPSNTLPRMRTKIRDYLAAGVRMVWLIDPLNHSATVYEQSTQGTLIWEDGTLTGGDVFPGFQCRVADFFRWCPFK